MLPTPLPLMAAEAPRRLQMMNAGMPNRSPFAKDKTTSANVAIPMGSK